MILYKIDTWPQLFTIITKLSPEFNAYANPISFHLIFALPGEDGGRQEGQEGGER